MGTIFSYSYIVFCVLGLCVGLYIICLDIAPEYKLIWVFTVLVLPIFGCMLYWFYGRRRSFKGTAADAEFRRHLPDDGATADALERDYPDLKRQTDYIRNRAGFPIYSQTETAYFCCGEEAFPAMLAELSKAERFIFLEYFIIEEGRMWDSILEILKAKADSGVEVRVIYDDMGCLLTLPRNYFNTLNEMGIKCCVFGRLRPLWSMRVNYRSHRKMMIIDGKTAFTGGINLADEYINKIEKHGYWKDSVIKIEGCAVRSFTLMFLSMWDSVSGEESRFSRYIDDQPAKSDGYALPFESSPASREQTAESIYLNAIASAKKYIYITTPYLILDNAMMSQLVLAAKSGVDVRIITPHIPDKPFVHCASRSNYLRLIKGSVRIYEFTPGFIHSKNLISDDTTAVVGTVNLDYRSFFLHRECGVFLCGSEAISDIKLDFEKTLERCMEISEADLGNQSLFGRIVSAVIRFFSPMM